MKYTIGILVVDKEKFYKSLINEIGKFYLLNDEFMNESMINQMYIKEHYLNVCLIELIQIGYTIVNDKFFGIDRSIEKITREYLHEEHYDKWFKMMRSNLNKPKFVYQSIKCEKNLGLPNTPNNRCL